MIRRGLLVWWLLRHYQLYELLPPGMRRWWLRLLFHPWISRRPQASNSVRLRLALESLGPVFIKFGQLLSTRRDLLPDELAEELARLQDKVPAFPSAQAVSAIESGLGAPIDTLFATFEPTPLAAASVAQVHTATLHSGASVVVKVLRPGIAETIRLDTKLIKLLALLVEKTVPGGWRLKATEVAEDYERTIIDELDLAREAGNASQLRRHFRGSGLVYVPEVHWPLTCKTVMVSERIQGIPIGDIATLKQQGVNLKVLAERGVEIFFTQVFRDSFFHADMHPGNIFVDAQDPENPSYLAVDCAIVGQLDERDLYYLARNLLAIFKQDYRLVAKLHVECGWVPEDTPIPAFESAMRTLCEPIFERPLAEISFGHMLVSLFRTAGRFNMTVQPQLVLLQKTLLNIEGLGRQLYPELNLWDTAQPFLEKWLAERYAPPNVFKRLQQEAPFWLETLPALPDLILRRLQTPEPPPRPAAKFTASAWVYGPPLLGIGMAAGSGDLHWLIVGGGISLLTWLLSRQP